MLLPQLICAYVKACYSSAISTTRGTVPIQSLSSRSSSCSGKNLRLLAQAADEDDVIYGGLHHAGILVKDVARSKQFLMDVFGFADDSHLRPATLPYPGAFLRCGSNHIHLMQLPNPDEGLQRPEYVGRDRHLALSVNSVAALQRRLDVHGVPYKLSSSGRAALFCRDIDANGYEFLEV